MIPNHSPWIKQLQRTRPAVSISQPEETDVVIVGGGIAGVTSAYFLLKYTNKRVILVEADKVAHGATGHNAGQITSYFERPLRELVDEFGLELAVNGQRAIESAWGLIDEIVKDAKLKTPLYRFTGHAGLSDVGQVLGHLQDNRHRVEGGLRAEAMVIAEEWEGRALIPEAFSDLYTVLPHAEVLELLETRNPVYIATLSYQKGCMNSAMFSDELMGYLQKAYAKRFCLYEESPVKTVHLYKYFAKLDVLQTSVVAKRVLLCTNGFERFHIENHAGDAIDSKFHHSVVGRIGYMSGYIEQISHPPIAISYFPKADPYGTDPTGENYFYLTRRPHEHEGDPSYNLICTGGPDKSLPNGASYTREDACAEDVHMQIDDFLHNNYDKYRRNETEYAFCWHGLMGYTPNGIRRVGPEPFNPILLYNLGCNGVGILPSVFGSRHIARHVNEEALSPTIFDPKDKRNEL